jgi:hypothetical protein
MFQNLLGALAPSDGQSNKFMAVGPTTTSIIAGPPPAVNNRALNYQQNKQQQHNHSTIIADGSTTGSSLPAVVPVEEENDDEVAESMLVQFPSYGTRSQANSAQWQEKTADWLLGGHSVPTPQQQLKQQQLEQQQKLLAAEESTVGSPDYPSGRNKNNNQLSGRNNGEVTLLFPDWAEDEQTLWKKKRLDRVEQSSPTSESNNEDDRDNQRNQLKEYDVNYVKPVLEDPSRDLLAAYYYHTGVFPSCLKEMGPNDTFLERLTHTRRDKQRRFQTTSLNNSTDSENTGQSTLVSNINNNNVMVVPQIPEDHEEVDEDVDRSTNTVASATPTNPTDITGVTGNKTPSTSPAVIEDVAWMPDRLCKTCYTCDTPFSFLRRRHHCRICGQVFCNTCSGYFVPAAPFQQRKDASSLSLASQGSQPTQQSPFTQQNSRRQLILAPSMQYGNSTILRTCKMCFDQVMAQQKQLESEEAAAADAAGRKRRKKEDGPLLPQLESGTAAGSSGGTPQPVRTPRSQQPTASSSPSLQDQLSAGDDQRGSVLLNLSKRRAETPYAQLRLRSQEEKLEQEEKEQTTLLLQKQDSNKNLDALSPLSPKRQANRSSSSLTTDINQEDRKSAVREGNRRLGVTAASQMEQMAASLMKTDAPLLWNDLREGPPTEGDDDGIKHLSNLQSKWVNKLMSLATRCCATVDPNIKRGDLLDIRPYVKIKGME